jgi:crotonobetainyl-CoA:carnitine CoA-transferase CaiB-like acyl-CoA transferase
MADWGAEVIKIESPRGDPMRALAGWPGYTEDQPHPLFATDNRGKKSVTLDLNLSSARDALDKLVATADVFVTNMRPGALERLGLQPLDVMRRHPHVVYASVTGYGLVGPDADKPGYDVGAFWARTGVAFQLTPPGQAPVTIRPGMGDRTTGLAALAGILAALLETKRTGRGRLVDASLLRAGLYCLGWDLGLLLSSGKVAPAEPRDQARAPLVNCYQASDGRWFFLMGVEGDRHFPCLVEATARPDLLEDERFATNLKRFQHRGDLIEVLDEVFATRPLNEWADRFESCDVWWAPVLSPQEITSDAQVQASTAFVRIPPGKRTQSILSVDSPIAFGPHVAADGSECDVGPVPELGEHTVDVLRSIGLTDDEIREVSGG